MDKIYPEEHIQAIANAIRRKNGKSVNYLTSEMAGAIDQLVSYPEPTGTQTITENGIVDVKDKAYADVNVQASATLISKTITANGEYDAEDDEADGYSDVAVNVPNSYAAADEGKVVSNGALVAQTSTTVTQNGTIDTTLNDEVVVNVPVGGGEYIFSQDSPTSADGNDGDTFIQYSIAGGAAVVVAVTGGYNGGAVIAVSIDGTQVFTATASDTYNRNYNATHGEAVIGSDTVSIDVTPPPSTTGTLTITLTSTVDSKASEFRPQGTNTSYGYGNSSDSYTLAIAGSSARQASALFIKQNGTWKGVGDIV